MGARGRWLALALGLLFLPAPPLGSGPAQADGQRNNPVGINLVRWTELQYVRAAGQLVNSNGGDWGYVTLVLIDDDRQDPARVQRLLDECARDHLTPIIRVATRFNLERGIWSRPYWNDPYYWRDLFDSLHWPTTSRYVVIGNEPNLGREWGGTVDPAGYARYLGKWLDVYADDSRYHIFNGALDASNDTLMPDRMDEFEYIDAMREAEPAIFDRLQGWASNPYHFWWGEKETRFTYRAYEAELEAIGRELPVVIMEYHAFEIDDPREVAEYYEVAFNYWLADPRVLAATPLFWNPESNSFWMYKVNRDGSIFDPSPTYQLIKGFPKVAGSPDYRPTSRQ